MQMISIWYKQLVMHWEAVAFGLIGVQCASSVSFVNSLPYAFQRVVGVAMATVFISKPCCLSLGARFINVSRKANPAGPTPVHPRLCGDQGTQHFLKIQGGGEI